MRYESSSTFSDPSNIPISGGYDFAAAFPSIIHDCTWAVLRHRKVPDDYILLFMMIYADAVALFLHEGKIHVLLFFYREKRLHCVLHRYESTENLQWHLQMY